MFNRSDRLLSIPALLLTMLLGLAAGAQAQTPAGPPIPALQAQQQALRGTPRPIQTENEQGNRRPLPPAAAQAVPVEENEVIDGDDRVFGQRIFSGQFSAQSFVGFNPDYQVSVGDHISLRLWGGFTFDGSVIVDAQGNIFIPSVGPVPVQNVTNGELNSYVSAAVKRVYKSNVGVYANLEGAEPVKVFVTGFVRRPGLYAGHASDSVLFFLDAAGGIDGKRGSYLEISVMRGGEVRHTVNLYDFLLTGALPPFQFLDGDTVLVTPVKGRVSVTGEVQNPFVFEFATAETTLREVFALARPNPQATHVRINRNNRPLTEVEYIPINSAYDITVFAGDVVEVKADKNQGTISVRVEGEHDSQREYVMPYGSSLGDLLKLIRFGNNAETEAIQLFRESVRERQVEMLNSQLRALERSVLTARSNTNDEAELRQREADLILQFVDRAEKIEPRGQVTLSRSRRREDVLLEPGDIVHIPRLSNLILVHGDVLFPTATAFRDGATVKDYIDQAGGFTQTRGSTNILLLHRDGSFERISSGKIDSRKIVLVPGDEIFVLPKVQTKSLQIAKDIITILYQLALSAGVVLQL